MKKIRPYILLLLFNWLIFIALFFTGFFHAFIFKVVAVRIANTPLPESIRTLILILWMSVPQTLFLSAINAKYFALTSKQFLIMQTLFASSVVVILSLTLSAF